MPTQYLHSSEPLPLAPVLAVDDPALAAFHDNLLNYLRRLTAKLSSEIFAPPVTTAGIETIALTMSEAFTLGAGGLWKDVEWNQQLRVDAAFTHDETTDPEKISIVKDGFYLVLLDLNLDDAFALRLIDDDDVVLDSYGLWDDNGVVTAFNNRAIMIPVHFHATQVIRIQVNQPSNTFDHTRTRLVIMKLGDFLGSGGPGAVDPCDLNPWQLCPE